MSFRELLRVRICRELMVPNYPLGEFDNWVKDCGITLADLLHELNQLHMQLEIEVKFLQERSDVSPLALLQRKYWCFYCEQIKSYYHTLGRHPELEDCLAPLLAGCTSGGDDAHPLSQALSFVSRAKRPKVTADHPPSQAHPHKRSDE
jgi:hypothetical protein